MGKRRAGGLVVDGRRLRLETRELPLEVRDEQIGEVVREAVAHDDAECREVGAVLGERVGGTCQPRSRSAFETSNTV